MGVDPFVKTWWFLEAHDGSWLADADHELFTRDPGAAMKWPNWTRANSARNGLHAALWGKIKEATEHKFIEAESGGEGSSQGAVERAEDARPEKPSQAGGGEP